MKELLELKIQITMSLLVGKINTRKLQFKRKKTIFFHVRTGYTRGNSFEFILTSALFSHKMSITECVKTICASNVTSRCLHSNYVCTRLLNRLRTRTESKERMQLHRAFCVFTWSCLSLICWLFCGINAPRTTFIYHRN